MLSPVIVDNTLASLNPYLRIQHIFTEEGVKQLLDYLKATKAGKITIEDIKNEFSKWLYVEFDELLERIASNLSSTASREAKVQEIGQCILEIYGQSSQVEAYFDKKEFSLYVSNSLRKKFITTHMLHPEVFEALEMEFFHSIAKNTPSKRHTLTKAFLKKLVDNLNDVYSDLFTGEEKPDELANFLQGYQVEEPLDLNMKGNELAYILFRIITDYTIEKADYVNNFNYVKLKGKPVDMRTFENAISKFRNQKDFPQRKSDIDDAFFQAGL